MFVLCTYESVKGLEELEECKSFKQTKTLNEYNDHTLRIRHLYNINNAQLSKLHYMNTVQCFVTIGIMLRRQCTISRLYLSEMSEA